MTPALPFLPVVILGAGRSGTNALRDMICRLPGATTWPCDEINPIWRHGNTYWPNDEIPAAQATPRVAAFIRSTFAAQWRRSGKPKVVVEKTCANTLRLPFVNAVLPDAKFIILTRNGLDVVPSAIKRWRGELEVPGLSYFAAKARFIPLSDIPYFGWRFVKARLGKLRGEERLSVWGPRFDGIETLGHLPLPQLCATQWARCVDLTDSAADGIDPARIYRLSYEAMTADPKGQITALSAFLGLGADDAQLTLAASLIKVTPNGTKPRKTSLDDDTQAIIAPTLRRHGYF